jgi:hypothetical protein
VGAQVASSGGASYLAVDDVNVYVVQGDSFVRIPKNGTPSTLINEAGGQVQNATTLGTNAYWVELPKGSKGGPGSKMAVKSGPLQGNTVSTVATFVAPAPDVDRIGLTSSTVFGGLQAAQVFYFPLSGVPKSGPTPIVPGMGGFPSGYPCGELTSDTDAVYCAEGTGSNVRLASDGTATLLGATSGSSYITFDDTYVYWVDRTTVGTIKRSPKGGGGTATILAHDTDPTAIAVDATSIYWTDMGGFIKSIPK